MFSISQYNEQYFGATLSDTGVSVVYAYINNPQANPYSSFRYARKPQPSQNTAHLRFCTMPNYLIPILLFNLAPQYGNLQQPILPIHPILPHSPQNHRDNNYIIAVMP
jgi:hypothetical protein